MHLLQYYITNHNLPIFRPAERAAASIWEGTGWCDGEVGGVAEEDWGRSGGEGEGTEEGWGGGGKK